MWLCLVYCKQNNQSPYYPQNWEQRKEIFEKHAIWSKRSTSKFVPKEGIVAKEMSTTRETKRGTGEMAQQFRDSTILAEDLSPSEYTLQEAHSHL